MSQMTQCEYIAILFVDCGYETSAQRRGWLQKRFGVSYSDELSTQDKHRAIEELKAEKEDRGMSERPLS